MAAQKAGIIVKKRWITVFTPKFIGEQPVAETMIAEPKDAVGRHMRISLSALQSDAGRSPVNVEFRITAVENDKASTEIVGMEWLPSSVKRLVRRGREKMDMSFGVVTGDAKRVRMKLLLLARNKTTRGVTSQVRRLSCDAVTRQAVHSTYEQLLSSIVQHSLQKGIQDAVRKVYPLAVAEVRQLILLGSATVDEVEAMKIKLPALPEKPVVEEAEQEVQEHVQADDYPKENSKKIERAQVNDSAQEQDVVSEEQIAQ